MGKPKSKKPLTASEMGKLGAAIGNKNRTFEERSKSAKKGWRTIRRKQATSK